MPKMRLRALGLAAVVLLHACGGGDGGETPIEDGGSGSPPDSVDSKQGCQAFFDPELLAQGEDCTPKYGEYCPLLQDSGVENTRTEIPPCQGVDVAEYEASAGRLNSTYHVLSPSEGSPSAVYFSLAWRNASSERATNLLRLQELAKARNALVIVAGAPGASIGDIQSWPVSGLDQTLGVADTIAEYADYLDAILDDVAQNYGTAGLPVYMSGLSNGGVMVAHYICLRSSRIDAALIVASSVGNDQVAQCAFEHSLGTVQVHGTQDLLAPYHARLFMASVDDMYEKFTSLNRCAAERRTASVADEDLRVNFKGATSCNNARRSYLVVIDGGGHNWPGMDTLSDVNLSGPMTTEFDATLQGFDMLTLAAGE